MVELVSDAVVVSAVVLVGSFLEEVVEVSEGVVVVVVSAGTEEDVDLVEVVSLVVVGGSEEVEGVEEEEVVVVASVLVGSAEELEVVSLVRPFSRSEASAL